MNQIPIIHLPTETPDNAVSIPVLNVDWMDERPTCQHVIDAWVAKQDTGHRCNGFGLPGNGPPQEHYCPINGGICAMHDPDWIFKPGWDRFAAEFTTDRTISTWPRFRPGDIVAYDVKGHCMEPTYPHHQTMFAMFRPSQEDIEEIEGGACVIQFQQRGLPIRGLHLKRLSPNGDSWRITADNPLANFEPVNILKRALLIHALALKGTAAEWAPKMPIVHIFSRREIVPTKRPLDLATA